MYTAPAMLFEPLLTRGRTEMNDNPGKVARSDIVEVTALLVVDIWKLIDNKLKEFYSCTLFVYWLVIAAEFHFYFQRWNTVRYS